MIGGGQERHKGADGERGPSWLRFGFLLAVAEVIILVLVVSHPGSADGARSGGEHMATSVGDTPHAAQNSPADPGHPSTTLAAVPPTSIPPTPVPTAVVSHPNTPGAPAASSRAATAPGVLPANIAPQPDFLQSCSGGQYDDSQACLSATLQAIANGRSHEGLGPMVLPTNWPQLSPEQQIFVATNLERTARGLPPMSAMAAALDQAALHGAVQNVDPGPPGGFPYSQWASNWAGAVGNPLEAIYFWMYDDGVGSANIDCTPSDPSGCWGHRENILVSLPCHECLMGTGWYTTGYRGDPSLTELLVETSGTPALDFSWQQESAYLP
ncbi:MAG TPA: hypothetical protein VMU64_01400 [Acidimicrobiales bacterium]|nr:hypothetical protein [Acidimicrobiales bacterium]